MSKRNRNGASILFKYELMYVTKAGDAFCVEVEDFFLEKRKARIRVKSLATGASLPTASFSTQTITNLSI